MSDIYSIRKRSEIMSKISGDETKPEILVRKYLFSKGFRFRKNDKRYPGKPDIVLPKYKTSVFIHGCFWHGHKGCKYSKLPDTRKGVWKEKIEANVSRDKKNYDKLEKSGWRIIIVWQCDINSKQKRENRFKKLENEILSTSIKGVVVSE